MKDTATKHKADCKVVFGRKDPTCPRCQELLAGAQVRTWRVNDDAARTADIHAHFRSHQHVSGGGKL